MSSSIVKQSELAYIECLNRTFFLYTRKTESENFTLEDISEDEDEILFYYFDYLANNSHII